MREPPVMSRRERSPASSSKENRRIVSEGSPEGHAASNSERSFVHGFKGVRALSLGKSWKQPKRSEGSGSEQHKETSEPHVLAGSEKRRTSDVTGMPDADYETGVSVSPEDGRDAVVGPAGESRTAYILPKQFSFQSQKSSDSECSHVSAASQGSGSFGASPRPVDSTRGSQQAVCIQQNCTCPSNSDSSCATVPKPSGLRLALSKLRSSSKQRSSSGELQVTLSNPTISPSMERRVPASPLRSPAIIHGFSDDYFATSPNQSSRSSGKRLMTFMNNSRPSSAGGESPSSSRRSPSKSSLFSRSPSKSRPGSASRRPSTASEGVKETHALVRDYDPQTGNKIINHYMILRELGRGFHGKVKLCVDMETGKEWALKIVQKKARPRFQSRLHSHRMGAMDGQGQASPSNPELEKIKREIAILKKCSHPHVVALNEVIDDPAAEKIYLVLEYLAGGDIRWHDQSDPPEPVLTIDEARRIFRDVVCGVEYLHYQGIVHRDIKPANLLWTADGRVKISDFGVSVVIRPSLPQGDVSADLERHQEIELAKTVGTPAFFAPEMCGLPDDDFIVLQHDEPDSISRQSSITKNPIEEAPPVDKTISAESESSANVIAPSRSDTASDEHEQDGSVVTAATGTTKPIPLLIPARGDDASITNGTSSLPPLVLSPADETFLQPEHNQLPIGKAIDIWAMGVTLYCFVFGRVPFMAETEFELFNVISRKPIEFPDEIPIDDSLRDLFMRLLDKDPTTRITLEEIKLHPWTTADLNSAERDAWLQETDPTLYGGPVEVTEEDVRGAVSAMSRLRERIRKLSSSFQNLTAGLRRRTKSVPSVPGEIATPVDSLFDRKDAIRKERRCSPLSGGESSCESLNGKLGLGSPPHHFSDTTSPDPSLGTSTHTHTRESSGGEWIRWGIVRNESFNSAPPEPCRRLMSPMTHPVGGADIMEEMDIHNDNIIEGPEQEVMRLREFQLTYAKQSSDSLIYSDGEDADEGLTLNVPSKSQVES